MTLKKLLMATSIVAVSATTANALNATVSAPAAPVTPALELQFPAVGNAPLQFEVTTTTGGDFPAGNNIAVGVTLPAGTSFAAAVLGTDVTSSDGPVSAVVQGASGQIGDTTVNLLISIPQGGAIDDLDFDFDIKLDSCPTSASPLTITVATEGGTPIEEGSVSPAAGGNVVNACEDAVSVAVLDDEATTPAGADTFIQLPTYTTLSDSLVGQVNGVIAAGVARDMAGTPVDATDIENVVFIVNIPDIGGIASFDYLGTNFPVNVAGTGTGSAAIAVDVSMTVGGVAQFFAGGNDISVNVNGNTVATQQLSVSGINVDFLDAVTGGTPAAEPGANANFVPNEAQTGGNIDFLQREGQTFGVFDWVGGNPDRTVTVLRATGLPTMAPTPFTVTFSNSVPPSLNGMTFTGTYDPSMATGDLAGSGEFTMNTALGMGLDNPPTFLRADILVNFESNANIDVDRLMARNGIITDFGDDANTAQFGGFGVQPIFDADQNNGAE